ncbi:hypothetical protein K3172_03220 [Qipengyuania sp. 6B39]|uniref:hypothetical protein n=1 Tax=Qipengyuania proteolytica TaxID=2867239 RepID=UPI001C89F01A|nr:hypothetical protein [Qipengyuania proteolytica]MBX7494866.1 hypothetical protein [Qipengyuania proteolytica]
MLTVSLDRFVAWFRGGYRHPAKLERHIIEAVASSTERQLGERLLEHVRRANLIQRLDRGREVNFYTIENGKVRHHDDLRLSEGDGEALFATVTFVGSNGVKNRCKLWTVDGRFFSLEFDVPTEKMRGDAPTDVSVTCAQLLPHSCESDLSS